MDVIAILSPDYRLGFTAGGQAAFQLTRMISYPLEANRTKGVELRITLAIGILINSLCYVEK